MTDRPPRDWPRAMRADTAAAYLDISESTFRRAVLPALTPIPLTGETK